MMCFSQLTGSQARYRVSSKPFHFSHESWRSQRRINLFLVCICIFSWISGILSQTTSVPLVTTLSVSSSVRLMNPPSATQDTILSTNTGNGTQFNIIRFIGPDTLLLANYIDPDVFWMERIQRMGGLRGMNVTLYLVSVPPPPAVTTATLGSWIYNRTISLIQSFAAQNMQIDALLAATSDNTLYNAQAAFSQNAQFPIIAPLCANVDVFKCAADPVKILSQSPCSQINSRRFPNLFGVSSIVANYIPPFLNIVKLKGAQTYAAVQAQIASIFTQSCNAGTYTAASLGMTITYNQALQPAQFSNQAIINTMAANLAVLNPDVLSLCVPNCLAWMTAFRAIGWTPKAILATVCVDYGFPLDNLLYVMGPAQWVAGQRGPDNSESKTDAYSIFPMPDVNSDAITGASSDLSGAFNTSVIPSSRQALNAFNARFPGVIFQYAHAAVLAAYQYLEGGVVTATNPKDPSSLKLSLNSFYSSSFYGVLSTNKYGYNQQHQTAIYQVDINQKLQIISPIDSASADLVYPMPTWSERVYVHSMYAQSGELAIIGVMIVHIAIVCVIIALLIKYRNRKVIKAQAMPFSVASCIGSILAGFSILVWPIENNDATCAARIWVWTFAFLFFICPIIAKSRRIAIIFNNRLLLKKISDWQVLLTMLLLMAPQLLINIIWASVAPQKAVLISPDPLRPAFNYYGCTADSSAASYVLQYATVAYGGLLLCYSCVLALRVRHAFELFNDAKAIASSVYVFSLGALVILALQLSLANVNNNATTFVIRSVIMLVSYTSATLVLLTPNLYAATLMEFGGSTTVINAKTVLSRVDKETGGLSKAPVSEMKINKDPKSAYLVSENMKNNYMTDEPVRSHLSPGASAQVTPLPEHLRQ